MFASVLQVFALQNYPDSDVGSDQIISIEITQGRLFSSEDVKRAKFVCILDSDTAKEIFGREEIIGESISVNMNGTYMDYEIIGIAKAPVFPEPVSARPIISLSSNACCKHSI